jgi:glutamyl-tRNA synthetase
MPDSASSRVPSPRVRFAPSPTGFLHVGSARTFIFNWLFARHNGGTMVLRIDDTDVERNTDASVQSIFDGLRWLGLDWDEEYKQSERLALHRAAAFKIQEKNLAYRDFTPAHSGEDNQSAGTHGAWLFNPGMREMSPEESDRRAAAGEPFALRYRVPRGQNRTLSFADAVYGEQSRPADEIEDFALLRSDGFPTYHLASCVDDADLRISHIIRGQDHLTNTFKHLLIFEGLGAAASNVAVPQFAHLPLLVAPDGAKLSKRKHGPVVSVTTYRDAGFLPEAFINFLCLLGWSPKNDREFLSIPELKDLFTLEGVNRANSIVNIPISLKEFEAFVPSKEQQLEIFNLGLRAIQEAAAVDLMNEMDQNAERPTPAHSGETTDLRVAINKPPEHGSFDPKAVWLNAEHIRALPVNELARDIEPFFTRAGFHPTVEKLLAVTPLIRERIKLLGDAVSAADFFFLDQLPPYDPAELIPLKKGESTGDAALTRRVLETAQQILATTPFDHDSLDKALREAAASLGLKAGPMFQPIRVAVCGRKNAPPLFETMIVLGREVCLARIRQALDKLA